MDLDSSDVGGTLSPVRSPRQFSCSTPTKTFEILYQTGPSGTSDISLLTPRGTCYYNPFTRRDNNRLHGLTMSPTAFTVTESSSLPTPTGYLSPESKSIVCPDPIDPDSTHQDVLEAHREANHVDPELQSYIEHFFKSQVIAPSPGMKLFRTNSESSAESLPASFTPRTLKKLGSHSSSMPSIHAAVARSSPVIDTSSRPRWNVSTQTCLSIPTFFDLTDILVDEGIMSPLCCSSPSSSESGSPAVTPVKSFQVVANNGSPRLPTIRPRLFPPFEPMEAIRERSVDFDSTCSHSVSRFAVWDDSNSCDASYRCSSPVPVFVYSLGEESMLLSVSNTSTTPRAQAHSPPPSPPHQYM